MSHYLVDYLYHKDRIGLVFYDMGLDKYWFWQPSEQEHFPYAFVNKHDRPPDFYPGNYVKMVEVDLYHPLEKKIMPFNRIHYKSPKEIPANMGGEEFYENKIKYFVRYAIDMGYAFGMAHGFDSGHPVREKHNWEENHPELHEKLVKEEKFDPRLVDDLMEQLLSPVPEMSYLCLDIEVLPRGNIIPSAATAPEPVTSIAFKHGNTPGPESESSLVLLLDQETRQVERRFRPEVAAGIKDGSLKLEFFNDERALLKRALQVITNPSFKILVTFNGDKFDIQYLHGRFNQLGIRSPFRVRNFIQAGRKESEVIYHPMKNDEPDMEAWKLHFDIYKFLSQAYIKNYAFQDKYKTSKLDDISQALVGMGKIKLDVPIGEMSIHELAWYNLRDVICLDKLMELDNGIILKLVFFLMRIGVEPFNECHRKAISSKILNLFQKRISTRGWIAPRRKDLRAVDESAYIRLEKKIDFQSKYEGAIVIEPVPGAHFTVECRDFTGLYTNIIYRRNLSFETVNCCHEKCKTNTVPEVFHHVCTREKGVASEVIGLITTARKIYFKPTARNDPAMGAVEQVLKVFGNASYGVFGANFFPFFLRSQAESNTAYARDALKKLIVKATGLKMRVLLGDTDSIFVDHVAPGAMEKLVEFSEKELELELNLDYDLLLLLVSSRKKNYLGIKTNGEPVIKGFKIKKSNSPAIITAAGESVISALKKASDPRKLELMKKTIIKILKSYYLSIWLHEGDIEDYAYRMQIGKRIKKYKVRSQHVRAAIMEADHKIACLPPGVDGSYDDFIPPGTIQSYIKTGKTRHGVGVKPLLLAEKSDISSLDYHRELVTSMAQLVDMLGIVEKDYRINDPAIKELAGFF